MTQEQFKEAKALQDYIKELDALFRFSDTESPMGGTYRRNTTETQKAGLVAFLNSEQTDLYNIIVDSIFDSFVDTFTTILEQKNDEFKEL